MISQAKCSTFNTVWPRIWQFLRPTRRADRWVLFWNVHTRRNGIGNITHWSGTALFWWRGITLYQCLLSVLSKCYGSYDDSLQPILRIWSESGMRFARILCCSCCRVAPGHAKENERSALAWDEELWDNEKQLCDRSLLSHAAFILELCMVSVLLIAAITIKSVLKP